MNSKLIFLDVDGTLTAPGGQEPPESAVRAIKTAQERGHKVFLCSGRNNAMMEPLYKYGFDGGIASCGGYVFAGETVLHDCPMPEDQKNRLITLFEENGVSIELESKDDSYCDDRAKRFLEEKQGRNIHLLRMIKAVWVELDPHPLEEYDGRPVYKLVYVYESDDQLKAAKEELGDKLMFIAHDFSEPDCKFGEVISRMIDKGSAVRLVAKKLDYDIADTVGFGDSMLDLEMIEAVGTSVCMDNGSPRLKKMSDLVCPAVEEDGIEWGFRKLGLID
ncbi:MAG: HAD family hydrolase [Mogibacterium sp.]|nr:HAD family hydrolase [Mogibacterium sp.]